MMKEYTSIYDPDANDLERDLYHNDLAIQEQRKEAKAATTLEEKLAHLKEVRRLEQERRAIFKKHFEE
jgi:hypothetical protein